LVLTYGSNQLRSSKAKFRNSSKQKCCNLLAHDCTLNFSMRIKGAITWIFKIGRFFNDNTEIVPVENSSKDSSKNRTRVVCNHTRILDEPTWLYKNLIQFVHESYQHIRNLAWIVYDDWYRDEKILS
jgi:hypothetical protein